MDKKTFIQNFIKVTKKRLEDKLPEEASEGRFIFEAYDNVSRMTKHILIEKLEINGN